MRKNEHRPASGLSDAIRAELARRRLTQGDLARHLQLSQTAIHRRMSGKISWRLDELASVAALIDMPVSELVDEASA